MKLTVLGSGTLVSGADRATTGFALDLPNETIVIDLGFGCFKNLQKAGIDYSKVNNLFFTHFEHPDHIADLVAFLFARKGLVDLGFSKPLQVNLFGGPGFKGFMDKVFDSYPPFQRMTFKVTVSEFSPFSEKKFSGFKARTKPMKHAESSIGFRFEAHGKSVVFSGDTEYNTALVELAKDASLLVAECNYIEEITKWGHMNAKTVSEAASQAGAKALLLHHFLPKTEKANLKKLVEKNYKGKILLAKDLMEVSI